MDHVKQLLIDIIESSKEIYLKTSKEIWGCPELSMQEFLAQKLLTDLLRTNGFVVETSVAGMPTSFVARYGSGRPVLGFNAEYDALPGLSQEKDGIQKRPLQEGAPGHGCGHNLLGTAAVMAAVSMKEVMEKNKIPGTLIVYGTPAEEICIGKPFMARAGLLDGVDVFLDWHPAATNSAAACRNNAYFNIKYHFHGKTAHGNAPWHGRSALDAAILMGHAIEMMREHVRPGNEDSLTTINYAFPDVGSSFPGVVPDRAILWCVGRMQDAKQASEVLGRLNRCGEGVAMATETKVETEFITATHNMIPNIRLAETINTNLNLIGAPLYTSDEQKEARMIQKILGLTETGFPTAIAPIRQGNMPVTDSSEYSWFAPLGFFNLALAPSDDCGWHNWIATKFAGGDVGGKVMLTATKVLALTAYDLLSESDLITKAQDEWKERLADQKFIPLIPDTIRPDTSINAEAMERYHVSNK